MTVRDKITNLFKEEKWTRLGIADYTINHFKSLDSYIAEIYEEKIEEEIKGVCNEYLNDSKNNITALYFTGIFKLTAHSIDDSNLLHIINIFSEHKRSAIVEHLAEKILEFGENRSALLILIDCYKRSGRQNDLYAMYERLVRVDYDEADIVLLLAEHKEQEAKTEEAISYYKKALHRYINKKIIAQTQQIWKKLLELIPQEIDFFFHVENRVAKIIDGIHATELLELQYPVFKNSQDTQACMQVLKRILSYDRHNSWARGELIACYRIKFAKHSNLEEYIKMSNLGQNWRNVNDAISDFEKHIAFDVGNFVYHRSWGVGKILHISDDTIRIHFAKNEKHSMSLKMAVSSLQILGKNHIWVYRLTKKKEVLREKVKNDPLWALKTVIRSFSNIADFKKIKAELVPHILSNSEWLSWGVRARKILKTNESFGNAANAADSFVVRDRPMNIEEKFHNRFKAATKFFDKVKVLQDYLEVALEEEHYGSNDRFREIYEYFQAFLNNLHNVNSVNEQTISALLIVSELKTRFSFLHGEIPVNMQDFFENFKHHAEVFQEMNNIELRKIYLRYIRMYVSNWPELYMSILPFHLHKDIVRELVSAKQTSYLVQKFQEAFHAFRERRELYIWFIRNCREDAWFKELRHNDEKILISTIQLYELTSRDVEIKRDALLNKKLNKQVSQILFKEQKIESYLRTASMNEVSRIYSLLIDVQDLDKKMLANFRSIISTRFPKFDFSDEEQLSIETVTRSGFLTLRKSYEERQRALKHLHEVEVPQNTREIAVAREFGDLKENAEYKAAKERQDILNNTARKWESELQSATIIAPEDISAEKIGFGTEVTLLNLKSKEEETLCIMGPWESNPEQKILSHLSPFAQQLLGKSENETLEFTLNGRDYSYTVSRIAQADTEAIDPVLVSV